MLYLVYDLDDNNRYLCVRVCVCVCVYKTTLQRCNGGIHAIQAPLFIQCDLHRWNFCELSRNLNRYLLWFVWYDRLVSKYPRLSSVRDQLPVEIRQRRLTMNSQVLNQRCGVCAEIKYQRLPKSAVNFR